MKILTVYKNLIAISTDVLHPQLVFKKP